MPGSRRVHRPCIYDEDVLAGSAATTSQSVKGLALSQQLPSQPWTGTTQIDNFRHDTLRQATVETMVGTELQRIFGSIQEIQSVADSFFSSTHLRLPFIARATFYQDLPTLAVPTRAKADFAALVLGLQLIQQRPPGGPAGDAINMQTWLYVTVKSMVSLLEATSLLSLRVLQVRLLVALYELGHGLSAASLVSASGCTRLARLLGLQRLWGSDNGMSSSPLEAEEQRRVWWSVVSLDR
jgi:hypothetical protein